MSHELSSGPFSDWLAKCRDAAHLSARFREPITFDTLMPTLTGDGADLVVTKVVATPNSQTGFPDTEITVESNRAL